MAEGKRQHIARIFNNFKLKRWNSGNRRRELLTKLKDEKLGLSKQLVRQALEQLTRNPYVVLDRRLANSYRETESEMTEGGHRSKGKHRSVDSRHRHRHLSAEHKLGVVEAHHITNASYKTDRRNSDKTKVDPRRLPADSPSRLELTHKRRRIDHDSVGESKSEYSPPISRTSEHPCDFRTQQSSNRRAPRSKHNTRNSASLLKRHSKHWENALMTESSESRQDSAQQPKEQDGNTKFDRDAEASPSNATAKVNETLGRDAPECGLSKGKSSNNITEQSTDYKEDLHSGNKTTSVDQVASTKKISIFIKQKGTTPEIMGRKRDDEANWTRSSWTTESSNTPVQTSSSEYSDSTFCKNKVDLSSDTIISRSTACPEAEADDAVNKNAVATTSKDHTQTSRVDPKSLTKQCTDRRTKTRSTSGVNINYKAGFKRKLSSKEDNTLLQKMQKKTEMSMLAGANVTIGDIRVSNNNARSKIHDESTEDEQVIEDNLKEQRMIRRRNKRYTKSRRDMHALGVSEMEMMVINKNVRNIFRGLFGENITRSESEDERELLKSRYVAQDKSIDSCSTEAREFSDDDNVWTGKDDIQRLIDESQREVTNESPLKMKCEVNPFVAADTENVIGKKGISIEFPIAKLDPQEATKVAKINMEEYISKKEMRELLRTVRRNLTKMVQNAFKKMEKNDRWSSEVKQMLREIQKYDESSFSPDKGVNVHKDSNSSAVLLNTSSTKLIFEDGGSNDIINLMKGDISRGNTSAMKVDCELTPKKKNFYEDSCEDSCENSCVSAKQSTNIDSILLSEDDVSNASTVIVDHDLSPISSKESICGDKEDIVEDSCVDMSANQSSTNTGNNQSLMDCSSTDTDNEVELEIKIKSKLGSTSETFSLKVPPSMRTKYIDNLKNNLRRMTLGISSEMTTSANANKTKEDDASEEALNTNQVITIKNIEAMSSIQQASCNSNHATQASINRFLQKENSQDDLRSSNDREKTMERDEAGNDQCVQSVERESMQTTSISAESSIESSAPLCDVPGLEKSLPRNLPSESEKDNERILEKYITAKIQPDSSLTPSNVIVSGISDTTSSDTTVASSRVPQVSLPASTSFVTNVSASSPATTSTENSYAHYNSINVNEETQLLETIGKLVRTCRTLIYNNTDNQQNPETLAILTILYKFINNLGILLIRNIFYYQTINYTVRKLNFNILQNCPTSPEEIIKFITIVLENKSNNNHPIANAMRSNNVEKSSQDVASQSIAGREIPHTIGPRIMRRNMALRTKYPNQVTEAAVNDQQFESNMNNAAGSLQQRQSTINSSQYSLLSNIPRTSRLNITTANINSPRFSDNANMPQTDPPSVNINWQQSSSNTINTPNPPQSERMTLNINQQHVSDSTNNIPHMQQLVAAMGKVERQQSSDSTKNIPLTAQSSLVTANVERQQFSASASNIPQLQQPSLATKSIERRRLSANVDNIFRMPPSSSATVNIKRQQSSDSTKNIPFTAQSSLVTANVERQQFSASTSNIPQLQQPSLATKSIERRRLSANVDNIPRMPSSSSATVNIKRQQLSTSTSNIPCMSPLISVTANVERQQFSASASDIPQLQQPSLATKSIERRRLSANVDNIPRMPPSSSVTMNIKRQQSSDSTKNISLTAQSSLVTANVERQQFSASTNNIPHIQQLVAAMGKVERQQSSDSTKNIPLTAQSSLVTANVEQQQFSASASDIPRLQQPSLATKSIERRRLSANVDNIPRMPQSSPATINIRRQQSSNGTNDIPRMLISATTNVEQQQFWTSTGNTPRVQQPSLATKNVERQQSLANVKDVQHANVINLNNNTARVPGFVPVSGSTTTGISQQQFPSNIPYTSHALSPGKRAAVEKYQQFGRFVGFEASGNVSNVPRVPHPAVSILNISQASQSANVAMPGARESLRDTSYVSNQQQFRSGYPECPNFYMLPGTTNVIARPPFAASRKVSSLPTNAAISDNIQRGQGRGTSWRTDSRATALVPNVQQPQQANLQQQQSSGSASMGVLNILPNYANMASTMGNIPILFNHLINTQTQVHQSYRMPSPCLTSRYQPQSRCVSNTLQISAMKNMHQQVNVNQQSYNTIQQSTGSETPQKTRSLRQDVLFANVAATSDVASSNLSTINEPSNIPQSVIPSDVKTQKRKCTYRSKTTAAMSSHPQFALQGVPEGPVSSGKNIPQNSATGVGEPTVSLESDASQRMTGAPSLNHMRETPVSLAKTSTQDASAKYVDNAFAENPAARSAPQKRKVKTSTTIVSGDTSNFRTLLHASSISEDLSKSCNSPSNSKSQNMPRSTPTESTQEPSQSAATTFSFNLDVFTDIQKLIIQDHLERYFKVFLEKMWDVLTKKQFKTWRTERSLLHCFYNSLQKYTSQLKGEDAEITQENEATSLFPYWKQKESAKQSETELRRGEKLEKTIQCLKNNINSKTSAAKSTPSSSRSRDEKLLRTSNSPKHATTEAPSSKHVESPQQNEDGSTLCSNLNSSLEKLNVPRENADSAMEAQEPDRIAKRTEQESAEKAAEQPLEPSSPVLVIDTQNLADKYKEKAGSDAQQEQSDEILLVGEHEPDIWMVNVIKHEVEKLENLSEDIIDVSPTDFCQSSPDAEPQDSEIANAQLMPKCEVEKLENLSEDIIDVSPIDFCQSSPDVEPQDSEIANDQLTPKREVERLENLSEDIIDVSPIDFCQSSPDVEPQDFEIANDQLTPKREVERLENLSEDIIDVSPIDFCQSSPDVEPQDSEIANDQLTPKREVERLENLSEDIIDVSPIDFCLNSPDVELQDSEVANDQLMPKREVERFENLSEDIIDISPIDLCRLKAQSIDISTRRENEEEESTLPAHSELGTTNEQLDYLSEPEHCEEPQVLLVKNEQISDRNIYEDIIIEDDTLTKNVAKNDLTETEDLKVASALNILDIRSKSPILYEKINSDVFLIQDDQPQLLDEKENKELSNVNNNLEIVDEEDIPCLRCKRTSTVCCENCLAAYYCSERCSKLHWYSNHHKHCKPYNRSS